jgi:hypothetical protein
MTLRSIVRLRIASTLPTEPRSLLESSRPVSLCYLMGYLEETMRFCMSWGYRDRLLAAVEFLSPTASLGVVAVPPEINDPAAKA